MFLAGVKNSTKATLSSDEHKQRGQKSKSAAPAGMVNKQVKQSLFGEKKQINLKHEIRSIKRLLNKPDLPSSVVARKQVELKILEDQLVDKQKQQHIHHIDKKYKLIKFVERQKVTRRLRSLQKQLLTMESVDKTMSEEERKVRQQIELTQRDLDYIEYYPKGMRYVALFPGSKHTADADADADAGTEAAGEENEEEADNDNEDDDDNDLVIAAATKPVHTNASYTSTGPKGTATATAAADHEERKMDDDSQDDAARKAVEEQREAIRALVKKAKDRATHEQRKAAAAISTGNPKKEKRRREFRDPFFTPVGGYNHTEHREQQTRDQHNPTNNRTQDKHTSYQNGTQQRYQPHRDQNGNQIQRNEEHQRHSNRDSQQHRAGARGTGGYEQSSNRQADTPPPTHSPKPAAVVPAQHPSSTSVDGASKPHREKKRLREKLDHTMHHQATDTQRTTTPPESQATKRSKKEKTAKNDTRDHAPTPDTQRAVRTPAATLSASKLPAVNQMASNDAGDDHADSLVAQLRQRQLDDERRAQMNRILQMDKSISSDDEA